MTGFAGTSPFAVRARLEDELVALAHHVFGLNVGEGEVGGLPRVAGADEEQRHAVERRGAGGFGQVVARGGHAVGEHDDGRERAAAELLQHVRDAVAEVRPVAGRFQLLERVARVRQLRLVFHRRDQARLGLRVHGEDVNLHLLFAEQPVEPVGVLVREEHLREPEPIGLRKVSRAGEFFGLRAHGRVAQFVHLRHARGGVEEDDDFGQSFAVEREPELRKNHEQREQKRSRAEQRGHREPAEPAGGALHPVHAEREREAHAREPPRPCADQ